MSSEDPAKQSIFDDSHFLDDLADLDRGLLEEGGDKLPKARAAPTATPIPRSTTASLPVPPRASTVSTPALFSPRTPTSHRARRLVDLFPSTADLESATAARVAPSPTLAPVPMLEAAPEVGRTRAPAPRIAQSDARRLQSSEIEKPAGYERFYGLDERPFTLTTDPRFLYHSAAHDRAAQAILDAIRRRDGIVMLTGERGMGKTLLCHAVMEQLDRRTLTSLVADPFVAPEDLLRTVLVDFGVISQTDRSTGHLSKASLADLLAALRDFLYSLAPIQAFAVVIIDEAQRLSVDLLKQVELVADTGGDEQLLQLILVGQPSLVATLSKQRMRSLFQRVSARATLGPLGKDEIFSYVTHQLQVAGRSTRIEFDARALEQVYALSRGVPRVVNLLCDRALTLGARDSARTIDARLVHAAAADLSLVPRLSKTVLATRTAAMAVGFALLMLFGAGVAGFVFRSNVAALMEQWQAPPAPPPAPRPDVVPTMAPPPVPRTKPPTP